MSYAIHRDPCYYAGTLGVSRPGLLAPIEESVALTVDSETDALLLCAMLNDTGTGPYMLSHGQYAAPHHEVRKVVAPARYTLKQAMIALELQHDFAADGSRLTLIR